MKTLVISTIAAATLAASAFAAEPKKQLTLEERQARKEAFQARMYSRTGGFLERKNPKGRRFAYLNMQGRVAEGDISEPIATMTRILQRKIVLEKFDGKFAVNDAENLLKKSNAAEAIFLVDDAAAPRFLIAPESKWAMINVAALNADKPDKLVLANRVRLEMWRAFALLNGAANSMMGKCVLQTVFSNADIDALEAKAFCPEPMNKIMMHLDKTDVMKLERCSYKRACEEGWAPAPTNDVQKAIYETVKAEQAKSPTKGIKIDYDPKKGK